MRRNENWLEKIKSLLTKDKQGSPDWYLIGAIWLLVFLGLLMIASAGVALGWQKYQDAYWHLKHQLTMGVLPGVVAFWICSRIDYKRWEKLASPMLFASIVLLILVFVPGIGAPWGTSHKIGRAHV